MPYISKNDRPRYDQHIDDLHAKLKDLPVEILLGHLNYVFSRLAFKLCKEKNSYAKMAAVSSALGEAQAEFRRRILSPYENEKIVKNGDIAIRGNNNGN